MESRENDPPVEQPLPGKQQTMPPSTTTRSSLLQELQIIWDEIGESSNSRDKMLLELEQECLGLYKRKVEKTREYRAELQRWLADAKVEIARLMSALGEQVSLPREEGSLTDQISTVETVREDLLKRKDLRRKEFSMRLMEIAEISSDTEGNDKHGSSGPEIDESDLTQKKLDELGAHLQQLCYEKVQGYVRIMHKTWKLVGTLKDERKKFNHISSLGSVKADVALKKVSLGVKIVREAQEEVKRLNALKTDEMRLSEVKEVLICREVDTAEEPLLGEDVPQRTLEEEADIFITKMNKLLEDIRKEFRRVEDEKSESITVDFMLLLRRGYTLPEMETFMQAKHGSPAGQFFQAVVMNTDDPRGASFYERYANDCARTRREKEGEASEHEQ